VATRLVLHRRIDTIRANDDEDCRVGKDRYRDALAWPRARSMEMRARTMEGYVYIDPLVPTNGAL
jgi:hypothetical protein